MWHAARPQSIRRVDADARALFSAAISPDGDQLATGRRDPVVRLWKLPQLQLIDTLRGPRESVLSVAYSPDGKYLAAGVYDARIHLWSLQAK